MAEYFENCFKIIRPGIASFRDNKDFFLFFQVTEIIRQGSKIIGERQEKEFDLTCYLLTRVIECEANLNFSLNKTKKPTKII